MLMTNCILDNHKKVFCKCFFAILSLLIVYNCKAQSKISGKVVNARDEPIPFANALLLKLKDSSLVKGAMTVQAGTYSFENIPQGNYLVTLTYSGFTQVYTKPFEITESKN